MTECIVGSDAVLGGGGVKDVTGTFGTGNVHIVFHNRNDLNLGSSALAYA